MIRNNVRGFNVFSRMLVMAAVTSLSIALTAGQSLAKYPEKPISMIVAYSPGGGTDTAARVVAKYVQPYLGKRLIIQNKPGAGGQIGFTSLAQAKTDGYRIGFINSPSIVMVKMLRDNVPYEMSDFEPIANIQLDPVVLVVKADSPYKTLADLVEDAKKNPGKINVGGDGPQSNNQLQLIVAEDKLGVDLNFVPYNGSGPAITSLLGGQVDAAVPSATSATTHINNGRLRALGVFSPESYKYLPGVPTIKEATGVDIPSVGAASRGIAAPKGISAEHKAFLTKAFADVMKDKGFVEQADKMGLPLKYMNPAEYSAYLEQAAAEAKKYIHLMK
ncbi:Bug family tripartite tricarboxylate transporter substrate binding protein [Desulforhopalus singaporensis]|uniref:Tripartite-type tricarboxylate transporter, receptor component TctC n=1 Tax=Desulforhopalus singaporensis TaxID=91360 RepID=A0A1H0UE99_9BACT|nr:tripartite tricarboxylate transporter substrate binding protein [Desulforhopalus singaporensis]SDP64453.1 Tripartite-type tricarboxylate transporter, receptor component TctC [Desulforhopalus singaporensis]